ncbi:MAG: EamA family transporter [Patescibacteria group bacterium]
MSLAVALEIVADVLFKKWSLGNKNYLLIAGLAIYMIGTFFWAYSLKFEHLSKAISVFAVLNLIILVLVGVFIFKENLSLVNKIGIILGIIGIILIEM